MFYLVYVHEHFAEAWTEHTSKDYDIQWPNYDQLSDLNCSPYQWTNETVSLFYDGICKFN